VTFILSESTLTLAKLQHSFPAANGSTQIIDAAETVPGNGDSYRAKPGLCSSSPGTVRSWPPAERVDSIRPRERWIRYTRAEEVLVRLGEPLA
jgi:hypothetical protein